MSRRTPKTNPREQAPAPEPMVDAREAAVSLRLPHYWFSDPAMRDRYRIPHYLLGGLVRYRMSELYAWAEMHTHEHRSTTARDSNPAGGTAA